MWARVVYCGGSVRGSTEAAGPGWPHAGRSMGRRRRLSPHSVAASLAFGWPCTLALQRKDNRGIVTTSHPFAAPVTHQGCWRAWLRTQGPCALTEQQTRALCSLQTFRAVHRRRVNWRSRGWSLPKTTPKKEMMTILSPRRCPRRHTRKGGSVH